MKKLLKLLWKNKSYPKKKYIILFFVSIRCVSLSFYIQDRYYLKLRYEYNEEFGNTIITILR